MNVSSTTSTVVTDGKALSPIPSGAPSDGKALGVTSNGSATDGKALNPPSVVIGMGESVDIIA